MSVELRRTAAAVSSLAKKEENQMHISVKYYVALIEKTTKNNGRGLKKFVLDYKNFFVEFPLQG